MNKFEKLKQICEDATWYLSLSGDEMVSEIRARGIMPNLGPDAIPEARIRILIAVDAVVPVNNEAEYALAEQLEDAVSGVLRKEEWKNEGWESWIQHLDGPARGLIA